MTTASQNSPVEERLVKRFGRDVPEGDGWSWEWETDPLAREAAEEIRNLRTQVADLQARVGSDPTDVETGEKTPLDQIIDQAMGGTPWTSPATSSPSPHSSVKRSSSASRSAATWWSDFVICKKPSTRRPDAPRLLDSDCG